MTDDALLALFHEVADAVRDALGQVPDVRAPGERPGQYDLDLAADAAALAVLERAGVGVLSEESGLTRAEQPLVVVIDPVDGSTNCSNGLPWYATSLCAMDAEGPRVALVANQASGVRYAAVRGAGAVRDGVAIGPSRCERVGDAVVGLNGFPALHLGWKQYRALGAAALDLCLVAEGVLDGYVDLAGGHGPWDYLGALLVCREAGALVVDGEGRDLLVCEHAVRRSPVAAATPALLGELVAARAESRSAGRPRRVGRPAS